MAFEFAGNVYGAAPFVMEKVQASADCYQGQLLRLDVNAGGVVEPVAVAAAGPDTTSYIAGICTAVRTSPTYDSTYQGDLATYDTTQAAQVANDPKGPTLVDVTIIRPGDKIKAPICNGTIGTNLDLLTATADATDGLTVTHNAITTSTSFYSVVYCRSGLNKGQYRRVTTGATGVQTVLVAFTYDVLIGDTFVVANVGGLPGSTAHFDVDSQFQAFDGGGQNNSYFRGQVLELNLEEAGKEWMVVTINPVHLAYTV